jgi:hypothetical protein
MSDNDWIDESIPLGREMPELQLVTSEGDAGPMQGGDTSGR